MPAALYRVSCEQLALLVTNISNKVHHRGSNDHYLLPYPIQTLSCPFDQQYV